jgi:hypothetical protein
MRFPATRERWSTFERRDLERLAREWLASIGVTAIESAAPDARPAPPRVDTPAPLRIAHLLLLGAPDGKTEVVGGLILRSLESLTEGDARRAFKELARDLYESHGIAWRNRFIEGRSEVTVGDITLRLDRRRVDVAVAVPSEIVARFYQAPG